MRNTARKSLFHVDDSFIFKLEASEDKSLHEPLRLEFV
nr:MAG TPA: hypothetical protein [Caudoviricetes sp.]